MKPIRTQLFELWRIGFVLLVIGIVIIAHQLPKIINDNHHSNVSHTSITKPVSRSVVNQPETSVQNTSDTSSTSEQPSTTPTNTSQNAGANSYNSRPVNTYIASVCTKTTIPFTTTYLDTSWLAQGDSRTYGGVDGWSQTCTADSNGIKPMDLNVPPYNRTVYTGTGPNYSAVTPVTPSNNTSTPMTLSQATNYCMGKGIPGNSSAWDLCINSAMGKY